MLSPQKSETTFHSHTKQLTRLLFFVYDFSSSSSSMETFYGVEFLTPRPNPNLEDRWTATLSLAPTL